MAQNWARMLHPPSDRTPVLARYDSLNRQIQPYRALIETAMLRMYLCTYSLPMQAAELKSLCAIQVVHTGPMVLAFQVSLASPGGGFFTARRTTFGARSSLWAPPSFIFLD